jgi:hypothetical protein
LPLHLMPRMGLVPQPRTVEETYLSATTPVVAVASIQSA